MSKKLSKYNYSALIFIALLILANLYVALPTHFAFSDNKKINKPLEIKDTKKNDFGSETVEPLDESNVKPLPLSLVEDPNEETENKTANKVASETKEVEEPEDKMEEDSDDSAEAKDGQTDKTLTTSLNGNEIDISALVKTFSKITKRNYIVDNNVKGKVAIHLASPVTIGEAIKIFESVLLLKGFTTVPMGYNTWKVISAKDAKQTTIPTIYNGEGSSEALVTNLMRLKNTQATDIQQAISQFVSKDGLINSFAATNSLIIIDTASNIKRLTSLVSQLDVPALDQDISIIPIQHADVKDVSDKIQEILGLDKEDKSGAQSAVRNPIPRAIPAINQNNNINAANVSGEKRQVPFKVIPDERTNSIICVADQITTDKVKALVEQLDSPVNKSSGKFYVYRLQHADAEEMAEVVGNLISGTSSGSGSSSGSSNSSANKNKSSSSSTIGNSSFSSKSRNSDSDSNSTSSSSNKGNSSRGSTVVTGEGGKFNLDGEVSVAADSSTNSLIINASKSDYEKIKELIDTLDVKRHQVLVEATILEVSLTKNEGAGLELQSTAGTNQGGVIGQTNFGKLTSLLTNPSALSDLTIAAASSGSIVLPGGLTLPSQALLISAVSNNSNVNVLSSP
ncbi:MAG: hypothetical protein KBC84_04930, partial [Proteobacteria bacterium]|nr:hypothetical protein [Pseudomonadota bacterium]